MDKFAAMRNANHIVLWGLLILISACAVRGGQLVGGPKDETPPSVVSDRSTPNFQTNFTDRSVIITMDEWVKLEDPYTQILISPPLEKRPDIKIKGRAVLVELHEDEVLRENATYAINFGEAIQDITENNPLKNYSFVFSTGDAIDSLSMEGMVVDAFSNEPVENALVMVYENTTDSVLFQEKPFYASRTDAEGQFRIGNMKEGAFKVVAITDENLDYLYTPPAEFLAFIDTLVRLESGQPAPVLSMRMSQERESVYLAKKDTTGWNKAIFSYNRTPYHINIDYTDRDSTIYWDWREQNLTLWYFAENRDTWEVYLQDTLTSVIDTVRLILDKQPADPATIQLQNRLKNSGHPRDPFYICFDRPIAAFDTTLMTLVVGKADTIQPEIEIIDSLPMCLALNHPWQADSMYRLTMLPGTLTDIYGLTNDTISQRFPVGSTDRFGNIMLSVDGLEEDKSYIIALLQKDDVVVSYYASGVEQYDVTIAKLNPATYHLRVTEDANKNQRWDPADYWKERQPEITTEAEIEPLRANWDVEVQFTWMQK